MWDTGLRNLACMVQEAATPWEEEALDRLSALARASLPSSLPALHHALASALAALPQANPAAAAAGEAVLERLWMMVKVVASVAADDVHGEVPMVPADVEALCEEQHATVADLRAIGEILRQACLPLLRCPTARYPWIEIFQIFWDYFSSAI